MARDDSMTLDLTVPNTTIGDYLEAKGALLNAAGTFIDWEAMHNGALDAIAPAGRILLQIADRLPN